MKSATELKRLQSNLVKANEELAHLFSEKAKVSNAVNKATQVVNNINKKIKQLTARNKPVVVTEHATLRYIERVIGINLDDIHNIILNDEVKAKVKAFGNGKYEVEGGFSVVVKENTIVTVEV